MTAKEIELLYIQQFLQFAKYHIVDCKPCESPDSICTVRQSGQAETKVVGIEHTDYYNDATPGQLSPGQRLYDFWKVVTQLIESRIGDDSEFHNIHGRFKLNKKELKAKDIRSKKEGNDFHEEIAKEMYDLVDEFLLSCDQIRSYCTYTQVSDKIQPIPDVYAKLNQYFLQIDLQKIDLWQSIFYGWHANIHASYIGLSVDKLIEIVHDKQNRRQNYCTDNTDELWLLIAAPATTIYNAIPNHPCVVAKLDDKNLRDKCQSSGFNKVFFWSRMPEEWFRQIWPT